MGMPGRKGWKEELNIAQRYSDLSEPFFEVLKEALASEDKAEKKWAVEQLSKGFVKMIPQQVGGDPNNPLVLQFADAFTAQTSGRGS